jgi:hypothetical protein
MFAQSLAQRLSGAGVHYGWAIVGNVFVVALITAGWMGISGDLIVIGAAVAAWAGGCSRSTFEAYLPAYCGAGAACTIAAAAVWLIVRTQSARERLVEARA